MPRRLSRSSRATDLIAAWQVAGDLRARQPGEMFIAGEMCSTH
jgi:hypothetical protein